MIEPIKIMVSSVNTGLENERKAISDTFRNINYIKLIGSDPFIDKALTGSSSIETIRMAKECDLYILILSERYGYKIYGDKSATEVEYDIAVADDPTKIMVFLKDTGLQVEPEQKQFIERVSDYHSGYFRPSFKTPEELSGLVYESVFSWLVNKCHRNATLTCIDRFIQEIQGLQFSNEATILYRTTELSVELEIKSSNKSYIIKYEKLDIIKNFWGCIKDFQVQLFELYGDK